MHPVKNMHFPCAGSKRQEVANLPKIGTKMDSGWTKAKDTVLIFWMVGFPRPCNLLQEGGGVGLFFFVGCYTRLFNRFCQKTASAKN